jgi:hypothetical protein
LRESDFSIEKAELKLKLADLMGSLADAKIQMAEVQDAITERENRIRELEEAFQSKDKVIKSRDSYYDADDEGQPHGEPYCAHCWEVKHKKYHMHLEPGNRHARICLSCKNKYQTFMTPPMIHGKVPGAE